MAQIDKCWGRNWIVHVRFGRFVKWQHDDGLHRGFINRVFP